MEVDLPRLGTLEPGQGLGDKTRGVRTFKEVPPGDRVATKVRIVLDFSIEFSFI